MESRHGTQKFILPQDGSTHESEAHHYKICGRPFYIQCQHWPTTLAKDQIHFSLFFVMEKRVVAILLS
jgi:hypothetical protein